MDAVANQSIQGNRNQRMAVVAVALFAFQQFPPDANGQSAQVVSVDGDRGITHSLSNAPQPFAAVRWDIQNSQFQNGCVVQWQAQAFAHESDPAAKADCELSVELTKSSGYADWQVTSAIDSTNIATGKDTATVSVAADDHGNACVEIQVRFLQDDVLALTAGDYQTTLIGTITGL